MKKVIALLVCMALSSPAVAAGVDKVVCHDKLDKKGQVVKDKKGNVVQSCKTIKVHKKLEVSEPSK
jgi:hypothetical protein